MAKKIEMPTFDGTDLIGWIARAEQHFEIQGTLEELKIFLAPVSMEGVPLHWLRWLRQKNPQLSWNLLKEKLMQRYTNDISENPNKHLNGT